MSVFYETAGLLSESWQKELLKKFPAYASAPLSAQAKADGAVESVAYKTGEYSLKNAVPGAPRIKRVSYAGNVIDVFFRSVLRAYAGVRVALLLIYNPKCNLVKGCQRKIRIAEICNGEIAVERSEASIVKYAGNEYIWLNKTECESGQEKTMKLVSVELLAKEKSFSPTEENDYANATELRKQIVHETFKNASVEELGMIVPVRVTSEDNYDSATPIIVRKEVRELFNRCIQGDMSIEKLKIGLHALMNQECERNNATVADINNLGKEISAQKHVFDTQMTILAKKAKIAPYKHEIESAKKKFVPIIDEIGGKC